MLWKILNTDLSTVAPVFERLAGKLTAPLKRGSRPVIVELNAEVHRIMAEAMLTLILGEASICFGTTSHIFLHTYDRSTRLPRIFRLLSTSLPQLQP